MENYDHEKYERAQKRVKEIKGFYIHLTVYICVNLFIALSQLGLFSGSIHIGMPGWSFFTTPFFWGIGLFFHGIHVFKDQIGILRGWEERKIKEYMEREEREFRDTFKNNKNY